MAFALIIGLPATPVHSRILNPNASLTLSYSLATTEAETSETRISAVGQRYRLGVSLNLRAIGSLRADGSSFVEEIDSRTETLDSDRDEKRRLDVLDFRLAADLFPLKFPLSLTANRVFRKNKVGSISTDETINTFGAHWIGIYPRLPRLTLSYNRTVLDTETDQGSKDFSSQAVTVLAEGSIKNTRISTGYQVSENKVQDSGTSRSQGLNLGVNSQLTPNLQISGTARYSSSQTPPSVVTGSTGLLQERNLSLSAIYLPPLYWWDGNISYSYSESPFLSEFKSHMIAGNVNLRPRERLDAHAGMRLLRFTTGDSEAHSESMNTSLNYNPFFGLRTGVGASLSHASTSNTVDTDTLAQTYRYNVNYFRLWRILRIISGYSLGYGTSTSTEGPDSTDLSNDMSLTVGNTNRRIVGLSLNTSLSHVNRETDSQDSDQTTYNISLNAESGYFRGLILRGDSLTLRSNATYTSTRGIGIEGPIQRLSATANYLWRLMTVNTGYSIENYPDEVRLDRQHFFGQFDWTLFLIRNLTFKLGVRDTFEDNRFRDDVNRLQGNTEARYRLGKNDLTITYTRVITDVTGIVDSRTTSDALYVTYFRPFF